MVFLTRSYVPMVRADWTGGQKTPFPGCPCEPLTGSMCEPAPRSNPSSNIPPPRAPAIAPPKSSPRVMDDKNQIGNRGNGPGGMTVSRKGCRLVPRKDLSAELAPRGIRVNAVSPGPMSTPFLGKVGLSEKQLNEAASAIENQVPLRRFGDAGEIAKAALFLA